MKKTLKLLGIVAIAAIIGFSFTSCGDSGPSPAPAAPANPTSKIFESKDTAGNIYILEITSKSAGNASISRAAAVPAYTPKNGDTFTLTIITSSGDTWTDSGTVAISGTLITLSGTKSIKITVSDTGMEKIEVPEGTTITIGSTSITTTTVEPKEIEPVTIHLLAQKDGDWEGWLFGVPLSVATSVLPKKDDTFRFRIRGTTDKTLEKVNLTISSSDSEGKYFWNGASEQFELSGSFDKTIDIYIYNENNNGLYLTLSNTVPVPASVKDKDIMATISNCEARLVGVNLGK